MLNYQRVGTMVTTSRTTSATFFGGNALVIRKLPEKIPTQSQQSLVNVPQNVDFEHHFQDYILMLLGDVKN